MSARWIAAVLLVAAIPAASEARRGGVALFDGRTLDGWEAQMIADNESGVSVDAVFRPEKGMIHVYAGASDGSAQPHAILLSRDSYRDYRLHVEYRWGRNIFAARWGQARDAGILLFIGPERPGLVQTWYRWPASLEYQIMERDSGSAYLLKARAVGHADPRTSRFRPAAQGGASVEARLIGRNLASFRLARAAVSERPGWNAVDIEVRGNRARFHLNGRLVNEIASIVEDREGAPVPMLGGRIALQAESAEIFYRNIVIQPLQPEQSHD